MTDRSEAQSRVLLRKSRLDLQALGFELHSESYGFHAQQCIEKALKAVIAAHGERFPFTHRLPNLTLMLISLGEELPTTAFPLDVLTGYAMEFRYEDAPELAEGERRQLQEDAVRLLAWAEQRVMALEEALGQR